MFTVPAPFSLQWPKDVEGSRPSVRPKLVRREVAGAAAMTRSQGAGCPPSPRGSARWGADAAATVNVCLAAGLALPLLLPLLLLRRSGLHSGDGSGGGRCRRLGGVTPRPFGQQPRSLRVRRLCGGCERAGKRARDVPARSMLRAEPTGETHDHIWPAPQGAALHCAKLLERFAPDFAISLMEPITRHKASASGYDGFVEQARFVSRTFGVEAQRTFGSTLLRQIVPAPLAWLVRTIFGVLQARWPQAHSWLVRFGVAFAPAFAYWLVGENALLGPEDEVRELRGRAGGGAESLQSGPILLIRKCKFMEASGGCKGLCLNLCKVATEEYCSKELGLPVYMDPNYEDFSCRMMFLQEAVPPAEDPAFFRPCAAAVGEPGGVSRCDERFQMPPTEPAVVHSADTPSGRPGAAD